MVVPEGQRENSPAFQRRAIVIQSLRDKCSLNYRKAWAAFVVRTLLLVVAAKGAFAQSSVQYIQPNSMTGSSMAAVVNNLALAHTAQLLPLDETGTVVSHDDTAKQIEMTLANIERALVAAKSGLDQIVKINVYLAQADAAADVQRLFARRFAGNTKPAVSFVVSALAHPDARVAMDAIAATPMGVSENSVERLRSAGLSGSSLRSHVAILPAKPSVFVSGQAENGGLASATRKSLESLQRTLLHLGLKKSDIAQLKTFLTPMRDVAIVENEIQRFFDKETVPPIAHVEWVGSTPIEIELVVSAASNPGLSKEPVKFVTPPGLTASPLYSRVTRVNSDKLIFISGLYGMTPDDPDAQVREVFASLGDLLKKTGSDFRHLVKATYYVSDDPTSTKLNQLRPDYYDPKRPPAASKAMVRGVGMPGRSITLDMIAVPGPQVAPADNKTRSQASSPEPAAAASRGQADNLSNLTSRAANGEAEAQYQLAKKYQTGEGVNVDQPEAVKWFRKAAEQGHAKAQTNLGASYALGEGVSPDQAETRRWFLKAADQGEVNAQTNLGIIYYAGEGVPKDFAEAYKWFRRAAEQGNVEAQSHLGGLYYSGHGVRQDLAEALKWLRKGAEAGNAPAQRTLGVMYVNGEGVTQDYAQALEWSRQAAGKEDEQAQRRADEFQKRKAP
ncbi:MAG: hypothetical protein FJ403_10570 [Verrucomicrobia bacterium]|nr:hypothetical protein [Verrucomicrobiota bacterium]